MVIIDRPSPWANNRPSHTVVDLVVIHGTEGTDQGDLSWMTVERNNARVSYHYLIFRNGTIYRLVPEVGRAWHAGVSSWRGRANCNDYSIGIALSQREEGENYTEAQYQTLAWLLNDIMTRRQIPMSRVVGHYHIAPDRKTDPWAKFDWAKLWEEMR